jgi:hypothetical protein
MGEKIKKDRKRERERERERETEEEGRAAREVESFYTEKF